MPQITIAYKHTRYTVKVNVEDTASRGWTSVWKKFEHVWKKEFEARFIQDLTATLTTAKATNAAQGKSLEPAEKLQIATNKVNTARATLEEKIKQLDKEIATATPTANPTGRIVSNEEKAKMHEQERKRSEKEQKIQELRNEGKTLAEAEAVLKDATSRAKNQPKSTGEKIMDGIKDTLGFIGMIGQCLFMFR